MLTRGHILVMLKDSTDTERNRLARSCIVQFHFPTTGAISERGKGVPSCISVLLSGVPEDLIVIACCRCGIDSKPGIIGD